MTATATCPTTAKLIHLGEGAVMSVPSPRVRIIFHQHNGEQAAVSYLGFESKEAADHCRQWLIGQGLKPSGKGQLGVNRPRKAERVETCNWELKIHVMPADLLQRAIAKDLARA